MMPAGNFVIHMGKAGWQIAAQTDSDRCWHEAVEVPTDTPPEQVAQHLAQALAQNGYDGRGVVLAIPSGLCLCATISTEDLPRKNIRQAMIYRLEEKLPIAAEDAATDFVVGENLALGVCVQTAALAPIVEALEEHEVDIEVICPTAMLAVQHKITKPAEAYDTVLWHHDQDLELFMIAGTTPVAWHLLADYDGNDLALQLGIHTSGDKPPLRVATSDLGNTSLEQLTKSPKIQIVDSDEQSISTAATLAANQILLGKQAPWINLRRDGVASSTRFRRVRTPLALMAAAGLLFLTTLSGTMWWRANHYQHLATTFEAQQRDVFTRLFPDQRVPLNVKSRLTSQQRRLAGLSDNHAQVPQQTAVLLMLRDALSCLPDKLRYRILELQLNQDTLYMEGEARSHSDAEAIAAALDQLPAFRVEPPRTEKLSSQRIGFTIRGVTVGNAQAEQPKHKERTL